MPGLSLCWLCRGLLLTLAVVINHCPPYIRNNLIPFAFLRRKDPSMFIVKRLPEGWFSVVSCKLRTTAALSFLLATSFSGLAQAAAKKPVAPATKKKPEIKEELTLKNGDRLTGQLLNSTGTQIKFKSDLAGEVTVAWNNVKELKSNREFAVIPKDVKDTRDSAAIPQGAIRIEEKKIVVSPTVPEKTEAGATPSKTEPSRTEEKPTATNKEVLVAKEIPTSKIGFIVDDASYQSEIHRKIGWSSGWDGHIITGSTTIFSTQDSFLLTVSAALKRSVPTVGWLDPKLRTTVDFNLSVGKTTQVGDPTTYTNVYHVGAERDEYFSPRGYYLQVTSFDHDFSQGLVLQQIYGGGVGATLLKKENHEFDITADLHYEGQQFNATADVTELNLHLIGSSLTEAYSRKWGKIRFDEKLSADIAWNNASAFSASGNSSVRMPVYKNLGFSVSVIDNFLNNPQVGYKKNSLQFSTGFALSLH